MFQIMVVDDDRNTRRLLQAVLEADGYKVLTAENGEDALALMDSEYVDLVVLDIMMPKMDGYEFTRTLRETNNNLPVLMVSAKELPSDKKHGFLVGTDDYMTKPIDEEEMLWRIKALLRRAKIASERRIVVTDKNVHGVFPPFEYKKAYSSVPRREKHPICFYITLVPPVRQSKAERTC